MGVWEWGRVGVWDGDGGSVGGFAQLVEVEVEVEDREGK